MVEQRTENPCVGSSILPSTTVTRWFSAGFLLPTHFPTHFSENPPPYFDKLKAPPQCAGRVISGLLTCSDSVTNWSYGVSNWSVSVTVSVGRIWEGLAFPFVSHQGGEIFLSRAPNEVFRWCLRQENTLMTICYAAFRAICADFWLLGLHGRPDFLSRGRALLL